MGRVCPPHAHQWRPFNESLAIFSVQMSRRFAKYQIATPAMCVGNVIEELSRIGSWVDGQRHEPPGHTVSAWVPVDAVPEFERWLKAATGGEGKLSGGDLVTTNPSAEVASPSSGALFEMPNTEGEVPNGPANDEDG